MSKHSTGAILAGIRVDRSRVIPLHRQVYDEIRGAILSRTISPGARLPSTRTLAEELGISRRTAVDAYLQLYAEGYVDGKIGAGTYVSGAVPDEMPEHTSEGKSAKSHSRERPRFSERYEAQSTCAVPVLANRRLPASAGRAFQFGLPAVDRFPFDIWRRVTAGVARDFPAAAQGYQDLAGYLPLRDAVSSYLSTARGVRCAADQVIIVNGSQQAMAMIAHILVNPGDLAWVEEPGYFGARGALLGAGATLAPVPVDEDGMDVGLGKRLWPSAKIAIVTPSHQMPLGMTMSLQRRMALLEWAAEAKSWIIEDDYDSEFRYGSRPLAALQGLDTAGRVIYTGTFSKVMFPALRLGYMVVPPEMRDAALCARLLMDGYSPLMEQMILAAFLHDGHFERHIRRMRTLYRERQEVLISAVRRDLGNMATISSRDGGMHLVAKLDRTVDDQAIAAAAAREGIRCIPLSPGYLGESHQSGLLLGYAAVSNDEIAHGVRQLGRVLKA